jgi:16S rRNA (guanine527-N7)-methyltransferase
MKKYDSFINLLLKYNKIHKLTGAKNRNDVEFLIKDSLYPFEHLKNIKNVLDIGTGAGFPGMVLAIKYPSIHFTLVEPLQKRIAFLYLVKSTYGLENVTILQDRVENIKSFDVELITSKAVSDADTLMRISKDFLKKGVKLLLYKGEKVYEEVKNLENYEIIQNGKTNYLIIEN